MSMGNSRGPDPPPQPVELMGEAFIFFKQNVTGNEDLSINGCTIP